MTILLLRKPVDLMFFYRTLSEDAAVILGVKRILEKQNLTVYVDWIDDPKLDRNKITASTAEKLRQRMKQSKSLVYAHSLNSQESKWMPWELGYFDGLSGSIVIFPVAQNENDSFEGQEYIGLYPYIDHAASDYRQSTPWINKGFAPRESLGRMDDATVNYRRLDEWMRVKANVAI